MQFNYQINGDAITHSFLLLIYVPKRNFQNGMNDLKRNAMPMSCINAIG